MIKQQKLLKKWKVVMKWSFKKGKSLPIDLEELMKNLHSLPDVVRALPV